MMIPIRYHAVCDIGCVRTNNEDMAYVAGKLVRDGSVSGDIGDTSTIAFAVADGMGGYEGGEVASEIACRSFMSFINSIKSDAYVSIIAQVKNWAKYANKLINETAVLRPELSEMGTTFITMIFHGGKCYLLNIGDSRCYRLRNGILKQLSTDHSERQRSRNSDIPSNLIYNYLGNCDRDFFSDVTELTPLDGDIYLLCSDGLSDLIDDHTIEIYAENAEELVRHAKKAGGKDNITVIRIKV